jgi:predicted permease
LAWIVGELGVASGLVLAALIVFQAVVVRPLPVPKAAQLVRVEAFSAEGPVQTDWTHYRALRSVRGLFHSVASFGYQFPSVLRGSDGPESVRGMTVTGQFFGVLGVSAASGRLFTESDIGREDLAVLSHECWTRLFAADPSVIGRGLTLWRQTRSETLTIVGVLPPGLLVHGNQPPDFYRPMSDGEPSTASLERGWGTRYVIGRLLAPLTLQAAESRLAALAVSGQGAATGLPGEQRLRLVGVQESLFAASRHFVTLLLAATTFLAVVTLANLAGLVLAFRSRCQQEVAIRRALGAQTGHLARQGLREGLAVGAASAVVACAVAWVCLAIVRSLGPGTILGLQQATLGFIGSASAITVCLGLGVTVGLATTLHAHRVRPVSASPDGRSTLSRSQRRYRMLLLSMQTVAAFGLAVAGGLALATFVRALQQPLGFSSTGVLTARVFVAEPVVSDKDRYAQLLVRLASSATSSPGTRLVALSSDGPLGRLPSQVRIAPTGGSREWIGEVPVSPGYFAVLGATFLAGHDFPAHASGAADVVVNASFATKHFGAPRSAIGKRIEYGRGLTPGHIIGVVDDMRQFSLDRPFEPVMYPRLSGRYLTRTSVYVITKESGNLGGAQRALRQSLQAIEPTQPVRIGALADRFSEQTARARLLAIALGTLGILALTLVATGIVAAVVEFATDQSRDLAIRSALGATRRSLVLVMVRTVMWPVAGGAAAGVVVAAWLAGALVKLLPSMMAFDQTAWVSATVAVGGGMLAAALVPALKLSRRSITRGLREL